MNFDHRNIEANPMRTMKVSTFVWRALKDQGGQVLPWVTVMLFVLLGMAGLTIDVGQAYVVKAQLQNSSNAAALASAQKVYNTGATDNAPYVAKQFSSDTGKLNDLSTVGAVTVTVTTPCLNSLTAAKTGCKNDASGNADVNNGSQPNAVRVKQTASVPTKFMRVFSITSVPVSATATAAFGAAKPWNVAIIVDATPSMNNTDNSTFCGGSTAEQCALSGIRTLLGGGSDYSGIPPCKANVADSNCPSSGSDALLRVAIFAFPNVTTASVVNDYGASCSSTVPTETAYTLPKKDSTAYSPITYSNTTTTTTGSGKNATTTTTTTSVEATYQITPTTGPGADVNGFFSNYFDSSTSDHLNPSSVLVTVIGYGTTKGCLKPPSGFTAAYQTYFAGAIYAAQAALTAEKARVDALPGNKDQSLTSNNAIIFISDGQANAPYKGTDNIQRFPVATSTATASSGTAWDVTSDGTKGGNLTTGGTFGAYPDYHNDCQQAIQAALDARNATPVGTTFYSVGYGIESKGCLTTDTGTNVTGMDSTVMPGMSSLRIPITSISQVEPCVVMENMASPNESGTSWLFYNDSSSSTTGCTDTGHTSTDLGAIMAAIGSTFTKPRLIPNDAT
jgi:Flp pilus assembly protein TadG